MLDASLRIVRIALLAAVGAGGCAGAIPPRERTAPPPRDEADTAATIARTHALFDAIDRGDTGAVDRQLAPGFFVLDRGRRFDRPLFLTGIVRRDRAPTSPRSCSQEEVHTHGSTAAYVAECSEPGAHSDGPRASHRYTLHWSRDSGTWQLLSLQLERGGVEDARELWNDIFSQRAGFSTEPNALLTSTIAGRTPGRALDVMMGQGRNALQLAAAGWDVTGIDISDEALRQATEAAQARGLALQTELVDTSSFDFGHARWDLVALIYAGVEPELLSRVEQAVAPGGIVVIEYFASESVVGDNLGGATPGQLARAFGGWSIIRDERAQDVADWGLGRTLLARFVAQKPSPPVPSSGLGAPTDRALGVRQD
jgi:SAM-dependent methyltransferase